MKRKIGINERMGRKRDEELAEIAAAIAAAHQAVEDSRSSNSNSSPNRKDKTPK